MFHYLVQKLMAVDDDCSAVVSILCKAQKVWEFLSWILGGEGVDMRALGRFYIAVVKAKLLFGSGNWVVTHHIV